jgi:hypothetical protein
VVDDWVVLPGEHLVASDRILIVRINGVGFADDPEDPLTMTSRAGLPYLPASTLHGVIAEMGSQFSSEIAVFGSMGSDPTTFFSVLSTPETLSIMLSRGTNALRNTSNNGAVRTSKYVTPSPTPRINCNDTGNLSEGDLVRIGGSAFRVTYVSSSVAFDAEYIFGSVPVPIAMQNYGSTEPLGAVINGIRLGGVTYQSGGIEQLPVVISTAPVGATTRAAEEVIFRGMVSKVATDTSARGSNQIKVDCQSIMGMIRNTPFRPVPMQFYFWQDQENNSATADDLLNPLSGSNLLAESVWDPRLLGEPWELYEAPYSTKIPAMQIRKDKSGGVFFLDAITDTLSDFYLIRTTTRSTGTGQGVTMSGFPWYFSEGVYTTGVTPSLDVDYGISPLLPPGSTESLVSNGQRVSEDWKSEIAFWATDPMSAIVDLIFGTYNQDTLGTRGCRPAGMSAWLPFGWSEITQILDYGSLRSVLSPDIADALPNMTSDNLESGVLFPYPHAAAKTVGDVLDWVFKRSGMFMVYDRGRLKFGKWSGSGVWPTVCDDAGLAEPQVSMNFDRGNAIQQVEVDFVTTIKTEDISRSKVPVTNTDRLISGSGKTITLGNFRAPGTSWDTSLAGSQSLQTAIAMVMRFSKAAAIVEVTYRDDVYDLDVGEFISFSTAYLPNAGGTMGLVGATGFVLKAARSWKTPTTKYTLFLYNYLNAVTRLSMLSATGVVRDVIDDTTIRIQANRYTVPLPNTRERAPTTDAEAFQQTLARFDHKLPLQLLDQYGTPYLVTAKLVSVDLDNDTLTFDDVQFAGARPGDVIVIADAAVVQAESSEGLAEMWDAFQADGGGLILDNADLSNPWMV